MIYLHPPAYPHVWLWESPSLLARDWPLGPVGHVGQGGWWGWTRHHLRSQNNLGCNTTGEMCFLVSRWTAWAECAVKHPKHKDSEITDTRTSLAHAPSHTTAHGLDRWWKLRLPIRSCARTTCFELFIGPSDFTWLCLTDSKTKRFLCYYVSGWVKTGTVVAVASYKHKLQTIQMWNKVSTLSSRIQVQKDKWCLLYNLLVVSAKAGITNTIAQTFYSQITCHPCTMLISHVKRAFTFTVLWSVHRMKSFFSF